MAFSDRFPHNCCCVCWVWHCAALLQALQIALDSLSSTNSELRLLLPSSPVATKQTLADNNSALHLVLSARAAAGLWLLY